MRACVVVLVGSCLSFWGSFDWGELHSGGGYAGLDTGSRTLLMLVWVRSYHFLGRLGAVEALVLEGRGSSVHREM